MNLATSEVNAEKNATSLEILQNPVTNSVVQIRYKNANKGSIAIYDLTGKLVKTLKVSKDNGDESISVQGLRTGNYILQLKSEKGNASAKIIVK